MTSISLWVKSETSSRVSCVLILGPQLLASFYEVIELLVWGALAAGSGSLGEP